MLQYIMAENRTRFAGLPAPDWLISRDLLGMPDKITGIKIELGKHSINFHIPSTPVSEFSSELLRLGTLAISVVGYDMNN